MAHPGCTAAEMGFHELIKSAHLTRNELKRGETKRNERKRKTKGKLLTLTSTEVNLTSTDLTQVMNRIQLRFWAPAGVTFLWTERSPGTTMLVLCRSPASIPSALITNCPFPASWTRKGPVLA